MEITCNMAKDLANLYICGAASDDSNRAIEEHLAACPECSAFYESYKNMLDSTENAEKTAPDLSEEKLNENVKLLSHRLRKKRRLTHIANAAFVAGGAAMLTVGLAFLINSSEK